MAATRQLREHAQRVGFVVRLAEPVVVQKDHRVGGDDKLVRGDERGGRVGFFAGDIDDGLLGGEPGGIAFVHVKRHGAKIADAHFAQQLLPARRLGGENDSHKNLKTIKYSII